MAENAIFAITLLRSVLIGAVAVAVALPLRTLLAHPRLSRRRVAWVLLLAPYLTPVLLTGYGYANFSLSLIHHPAINLVFYSALLWWKFTPIAALILYFTPSPISAEAVHCWRLVAQSGYSIGAHWLKATGIAFIRGMAIRKSQLGRRPAECNSAIQQSATLRYEGQVAASRNAAMKYPGQGTFSTLCEWSFLVRAGCLNGPLAAFAAVFLCAFAEFEMASLMVVKSWTVSLFDAHAGGLALGQSLRRMLVPLACEAVAIAVAFTVLSRSRVTPTRRIDGGAASRGFAWGYLGMAAFFVLVLPAAKVLWGTMAGFGLLLEDFVLTREIVASLLFAAGGTVIAGLLAFGCGKTSMPGKKGTESHFVRGRRIGNVFLVVAVFAGLLGPLVLSLTVLAAVQWPGLVWLRDTPAPLVLTLALVLLPMALVLKRVLDLTRPQSALHLAGLLNPSRSARELTWRLSTSGKFWALVLLFIWAYWDLTASAILAPVGMTPVTVRLYNLMHYGQIAVLSAMTCAAFAAPVLIFLLVFATRRWWAPR
ncbi:MAG TPA: hypothetical protein VF988_12305 [Verrucomicrobiae bacterium]